LPEGGDLLRRGEAKAGEGFATGPVFRGGKTRADGAMFLRYHALGQVIDLFKTFAPRDGDFAHAPQRFKRCLGWTPAPPSAFRPLVLEVARHQRSLAPQSRTDIAQDFFAIRAEAFAPMRVRVDACLCRAKAMTPMGIELDRDQRGVMRPVFEERHMIVVKRCKLRPLIGRCARKEDHVMGALDCIHGVKLYKAETPDKRERGGFVMWVRCGCGQRMMVQEKTARILIANLRLRHGRGSYTYSSFNPSGSANITA